jgi:hypothetical protein
MNGRNDKVPFLFFPSLLLLPLHPFLPSFFKEEIFWKQSKSMDKSLWEIKKPFHSEPAQAKGRYTCCETVR